jgi:pro-sigmaK processing inhibitor BofA
MDARAVAAGLFAVILLVILLRSMHRPLHYIAHVAFQAVLGLIFLKAWDMVAAAFGWPVVGLNLATAGIIGLLGFPGFLSLLAIRYGLS